MKNLLYRINSDKKNHLGSFGKRKLAQTPNVIRGTGKMSQQVEQPFLVV